MFSKAMSFTSHKPEYELVVIDAHEKANQLNVDELARWALDEALSGPAKAVRYYQTPPGGLNEDDAEPKSLTGAIVRLWKSEMKYKDLSPYFIYAATKQIGFFRKVQ